MCRACCLFFNEACLSIHETHAQPRGNDGSEQQGNAEGAYPALRPIIRGLGWIDAEDYPPNLVKGRGESARGLPGNMFWLVWGNYSYERHRSAGDLERIMSILIPERMVEREGLVNHYEM